MAKINLLPWRAERRERRKREFFTHLGLAAVVAIVLVLLWSFWMNLRIGSQNDRNAYLQGQIKQLDAKITEIKNLQKVKDRLLARKHIVEKLQASRSQMVHLFDQVVKTIPAGARLTSLSEQGDKLTLDGVAQSNATVAEYMRKIEASPWMGPARLVKTENVHASSNTPYEFELVVTLGTPKTDANGNPVAASSSAAPASAATAALPAAATTAAVQPLTSAAALPAAKASAATPAAKPAPVKVPAASGKPAAASAPAALPAPLPAAASAKAKTPAEAAHKGGSKP